MCQRLLNVKCKPMKLLASSRIFIKMIANNLTLIALAAVVAFLGLNGVNQLGADLHDMYTVELPANILLLNIDRDVYQALVAERTIISTDSPSIKKEWEQRWARMPRQPLSEVKP